ncbi:hypothetical protein QTP70_017884 [Hemibagrus guttatus]|uniref:Ig-like domain-containing protein n=1 Tax=Hemibagrus guttatus TaxID=175788 RepID=A0AAE0QZT1_9TELE|nr:hypothetical protein QTP70_017884 [Hemibagrus guttatus]
MTGTLLYIAVFILLKGSCKGVLITQWPKYISSYKNTSVDMHCYQNDTDYEYTYWYRQIGNELVLITRSIGGSHNQEKGSFAITLSPQKDVGLGLQALHSSHFVIQYDISLTFRIFHNLSSYFTFLLLLLSCMVFFSTGPSDCVQFEQPQDQITNLNDKVKISCKHNDSTLDVMLWYQRRKESTALALIGYSYATVQPKNEAEFPESRFRQTRTHTVIGDLTISNLSLSDSAVYYCAAKLHSASVLSPA